MVSRPRDSRTPARHCALLLSCIVALVLALCAAFPAPAHALKVIKGTVPEGSVAQGTLNRLDQEESDEIGTLAADKPDGVYYGTGDGFKSDITVAVTVSGGKVTFVEIVAQTDDQSYFDHAQKVVDKITTYQRLNVHTMTGATYSSKGILAAVENALGPDARVPVTSRPWFTWSMVGITVALLVVACWFYHLGRTATGRAARMRAGRRQRLATQFAFFVITPSTFASALAGIKYFFAQIHDTAAAGIDVYFEWNAFLALLVALLAFTVAFGRFFCGYACSFGLYGDLLFRLREVALKRLGVRRRREPQRATRVLTALDRMGLLLKYVVLVGICAAVYLGFSEFLNDNSPWVAFAQLTNLSTRRLTALGVALLVAVSVGSLCVERFFCRYLCPLGAVFSLLPTLPFGRMTRDRAACRSGCDACRRACPMATEPCGRVRASECICCGACANVCPAGNAHYGLVPHAASATEDVDPQERTRGPLARLGAPGIALVLAVLLVIVLWMVGAARFLPRLF